MKRYVLIYILLIPYVVIFAQDKFDAGFNIGYNSSTFVGNDIPGKGLASVSGAILGGFFRYNVNGKFSIRPEINYSVKGSKINTINNLYEYIYLYYLELPVPFVFKFRNEKKLQPIIYTGPVFSINTGASGSRGYLNDIKKIDGSIIAGTGLEVWKLSFQVRYTYGLSKFDHSNQKLDLRNSTLSVLVGFNFIK